MDYNRLTINNKLKNLSSYVHYFAVIEENVYAMISAWIAAEAIETIKH